MTPCPKPPKRPKSRKRRQRVYVRFECGCYDLTFRTEKPEVCPDHGAGVDKIYPAGSKYITEHAILVDLLDDVCSKIVTRRDGYQCVLCGTRSGIVCGHVFVRGMWGTRWDFDNLNAICATCNFKDTLPMHSHIYKDWYRGRFGEEQYQILKQRAERFKPTERGKDWTVPELRELLERYETMNERLQTLAVYDESALCSMGYYG